MNPSTFAVPAAPATMNIPVYRPDPTVAFRIRPEAGPVREYWLLELKDKTVYLVAPTISQMVNDVARQKSLYLATDDGGAPFLLPIVTSTPGGRSTSWSRSGKDAVSKATINWVTMRSDTQVGSYVASVVVRSQQPSFPAKTLEELIDLAFDGKVIETEGHPAVAQARSEKLRR